MLNNDLQCPDLTVHRNTLFMASGGVRCQVRGVRMRLSGKLTTSGVLYRDAYLFELIHSPNSVNPGWSSGRLPSGQ